MQAELLLAAALIITILALAFYAGVLISRIKRHNARKQQREAQAALKKQQRNDKICASIRMIAAATAQKQCNVSEAAIRLTILLDTLLIDKAIDVDKQYPALSALFHKVKKMPTHEQRKKVPIKELKQLDKQRQSFEAEFEERILKEAVQLKDFSLSA